MLGEKLAYQVDHIQILQPDDNSYCVIEPGRDLVTLVTCTPFGINNKRLVITATRTQVPPENQEKASPYSRLSILILAGTAAIFGLWLIYLYIRHKRKREQPKPENSSGLSENPAAINQANPENLAGKEPSTKNK